MGNYHQKKGKGKLPIFCGNRERVIPVYGRGTGTPTLEENLDQQLAGICNEPLLQVFLDVRKSYNLMNMGSCMEILSLYGIGTKLQRILQRFWYYW